MTGILGLFSRSEQRGTVNPMHPRDPALAAMFGGGTDSPPVDAASAMRVTAVYASVNLIAETMAALPLHVLRREGSTTAKAKDHPLYKLLHESPSPGVTSFEWRETMFTSTALTGDSYARIVIDGAGRIVELPILPARTVQPFEGPDGRPRFRHWQQGGGVRVYFDEEILRIPHKLDGIKSLSPISTHRVTIGNSLSSMRYQQSFLSNMAQPKGALQIEEMITQAAAEKLRDSWEQRHQGAHNAGRIAIFDGGMTWKQIGLSHDDAQYIQSLEFSVSDIARIYGIPPHKIGDLSKATFSNIENQAIDFVAQTMFRWVRRAEERQDLYLLTEADRAAGYYTSYDLKGLLRGDSAARSALYKSLWNIGAMSSNEVRAAEDLNPYDDGDRYFVQGASVPVDMVDETIKSRGPATPAKSIDE